MCAACAMAAMAGASGARVWLQARHETWLTPRRMKVATVSVFAAAAIGSSVGLKGTTPPEQPAEVDGFATKSRPQAAAQHKSLPAAPFAPEVERPGGR
jgi:hypothetical protein